MAESATPTLAAMTACAASIGAASSRRLAADGTAVVVHYSGQRGRAQEVVTSITEAGGNASLFQADVADEHQVAALVDFDLDAFDRQLRTNVRGPFVVSQQAARRLRQGGALINFSSSVTRLAPPTYSAYAATKGAVEAMTLILARELKGQNITVNAIAPGPVATPLFLEGKAQHVIDSISGMNPMNRLAEPADIAAAVSFLAGPDGRWVNGQVLFDNGGAA